MSNTNCKCTKDLANRVAKENYKEIIKLIREDSLGIRSNLLGKDIKRNKK